MTASGKRCPRVELAPSTVEGHALTLALQSPGCWLRAGMGGTVTGLDLPQFLARLSPDLDPACLSVMAQAAEGPVVQAVMDRAAADQGAEGQGQR